MKSSRTSGAVAGGHPQTAEAGARALEAGGNAVDAAVAAIWASFVAEPVLGSPAGGGYLSCFDPNTGETAVYDFFANVPGLGGVPPAEAAAAGELDFFVRTLDFGPTQQAFQIGRGSVAVPGAILGLWEAQQNHGRLPPGVVLEPAIELCRRGAMVSDGMAAIFEVLEPIITATTSSRALYAPSGRLLRAGERFFNPELGATLERLGQEGPDPFFRGDIAAEMVAAYGHGAGGLLTAEDLASYRVHRRAPLARRYRGRDILLNPAPSAGGPLIAFSLALLERRDPAELAENTEARCRLLAEVMALTNRSRSAIFEGGDPASLLEAAAAELDAALAAPATGSGDAGEPPGRGSTTHVSAIDRDGWAAAITVSNGESCGHVLPGRGLAMNNFLGEEDINPLGFHRDAPGGRMTSMMCPTLLLEGGRAIAAVGSGGSNRIRSAILQVLVNLIDQGSSIDHAVSAARLHYERERFSIEIWSLSTQVRHALEARYTDFVEFTGPNMFFGGVHSVARTGDYCHGTGDHRRGGAVEVVS